MDDQTPDLTHAPWTPEQVVNLTRWQFAGYIHPYTCGRADTHRVRLPVTEAVHDQMFEAGIEDIPMFTPTDVLLVPTVDGWRCPVAGCGYEQDWCFAASLEPPPENPLDALTAADVSSKPAPVRTQDGVVEFTVTVDLAQWPSFDEAARALTDQLEGVVGVAIEGVSASHLEEL